MLYVRVCNVILYYVIGVIALLIAQSRSDYAGRVVNHQLRIFSLVDFKVRRGASTLYTRGVFFVSLAIQQ